MVRPVPPEVKAIHDRAMQIKIKPVESTADYYFQKHGHEFMKDAIRACLIKR